MQIDMNQFLAMFSPAGAERLTAAAQLLHMPAGTVLFDEGDVPDSVYVVEGSISFTTETDRGTAVAIWLPAPAGS
jgi:CRP-like cAMP-binding protein